MKKIIINGKEYNSLDELPDMFKNLLQDQNKDGIPDIAEKAINEGKRHNQSISIKDKSYDSIHKLTPEQKARIQTELQKAQKYLNNPLLSSLAKGLTGIDINKVASDIQLEATKSPSEHRVNTLKQPKRLKHASLSRPTQNIPQLSQPGVKKDTGRNFLVLAAIIGFIGWLLYSYTDIL